MDSAIKVKRITAQQTNLLLANPHLISSRATHLFPDSMSLPILFKDDIVVQDYRPDGHGIINFEWGSYDGFFSGGRADGWGVQSVRRRVAPGALPSDEIAI